MQSVEPKYAVDTAAASAGLINWTNLVPHTIGELAAWFSVIWFVGRAVMFLYGKWRNRNGRS